jgi:hypothetical protein
MKPMHLAAVIVSCLAVGATAEASEPVHDPFFTAVVVSTATNDFVMGKQNWMFQCPPDYTFTVRYKWEDDRSTQAEPEWRITSTEIVSAKFVRMARGLLVLKIRSIKLGDAHLVVTVAGHEMWIRIVVVNDEPNV